MPLAIRLVMASVTMIITLVMVMRKIRRLHKTEAAIFRVLGTEAGPIMWNGFPRRRAK